MKRLTADGWNQIVLLAAGCSLGVIVTALSWSSGAADWWERYQTTIQTVASSVIGAFGIFMVVQQLVALRKQNSVAIGALRLARDERQQALLLRKAAAIQSFSLLASSTRTPMFAMLAVIVGTKTEYHAELVKSVEKKFGDAAATITPALDTEPLLRQWFAIEDAYNSLMPFVACRYAGLSAEQCKEALMDTENVPESDDEALTRAAVLWKDAARFMDSFRNEYRQTVTNSTEVVGQEPPLTESA
jgi:hypothetical protein